uniref:Uncharacterized protein n=1 Tax=Timema bartmani TaxID=61472 RepID=A0A7R9I761_9NEOP|nr:unnamed protein product [Timema bartmani]
MTKAAEEPAGVHVGGPGGSNSLNNQGLVHHRQRLNSPEEGHFQGQLRRDHGACNNSNQLLSHHHLNEELQELAQNPSLESDSEEDKPSRTFTKKNMATAFHRIQGLQMLAD